MISRAKYGQLKKKYGSYSSWAIWNEKAPNDLSVFESHLKYLNSRYVFLGLNVAAPLQGPWQNFHGGKHDRKLMQLCSMVSRIKGAYLTDIFKGIVDRDSRNLRKLSPKIVTANVRRFHQEMRDIGVDRKTVFIVLGAKSSLVYRYFNKYFKKPYQENQVISHHHHSYYGISDKEWISGWIEKLGVTPAQKSKTRLPGRRRT